MTGAPASVDPAPESPPRPIGKWRSILVVVGVTAGVWAISAGSMLVYTSSPRPPKEYTVTIPEGTGVAIARGENPLLIPETWRFHADDTLTLVNEDTTGHWLGTFFVPPDRTRSYTLRPSIAGVFSCSLHPAGEISILVELRGFHWGSTLIPTVFLGPVMGLVALALWRVTRLIG